MINNTHQKQIMLFKDNNEFSIYIENLKTKLGMGTIFETLVHFCENETDQDVDDVTKLLNRRLVEKLRIEAEQLNLISKKVTHTDTSISLF